MIDAPPRMHRVVVADDVADYRMLIRVLLEGAGTYEVVAEAADGIQAVAAVSEHQPDLVLLDLSMPNLDGLEALPRLRAASPDATVVVLSGFEGGRMRDAVQAHGADAFLEKGLAPQRLLEALSEVLARRGLPVPAEPAGVAAGLSPDDLIHIVAHDLRNPLAAVVGFGETLEMAWERLDDEAKRHMVARLTAHARAMSGMVANLLGSRSIDTGRLHVSVSPRSVALLFEEVLDHLRVVAGDHEVQVALPRELPAVLVDSERFRQVLANLVANAGRHSPDGVPVRLSAFEDGGGVRFEVVDEGPGIPEHQRDLVFRRYVRLDRSGPGVGLGLFICAAFMEAMAGRVWVDEPDGPGTRMCAWLPAAD